MQKYGDGDIPKNQNRVYDKSGTCPCFYSTYARHPFKVLDDR